MSARRDVRYHALFVVGLVFAWAGATVDPAKNCDESGRDCAPWLVPIAFGLGVLAATAGAAMLLVNKTWGSRVDIEQRSLSWWDTRVSAERHAISLDDVSRIRVRLVSEGSDKIYFHDREGALMPIPDDEIYPCPHEDWAKALVAHFPHIRVEVEHG